MIFLSELWGKKQQRLHADEKRHGRQKIQKQEGLETNKGGLFCRSSKKVRSCYWRKGYWERDEKDNEKETNHYEFQRYLK